MYTFFFFLQFFEHVFHTIIILDTILLYVYIIRIYTVIRIYTFFSVYSCSIQFVQVYIKHCYAFSVHYLHLWHQLWYASSNSSSGTVGKHFTGDSSTLIVC